MNEDAATDPELIPAISSVLEGRPELAAAYLYGSAATGGAGALSDIDVALVPGDSLSPSDRAPLLRALTVALEREYSRAPFDVRFFDELPVSIRGRVVTEGHRVLDHDRSRRIAAEVRARMEYHDYLYFEREGTREGLQGLRKAVQRG